MSARAVVLTRFLDLVVADRADEARRAALPREGEADASWGLGLASFGAFLAARFEEAALLAERAHARVEPGDLEAALLALAARGAASAGWRAVPPAADGWERSAPGFAVSGDPLGDARILVEGLGETSEAGFVRYLLMEASLACARVELALDYLALIDAKDASFLLDEAGREHPFATAMGICRVRTLVFAGRIAEAQAAHVVLARRSFPAGRGSLMSLLLEATGTLVEGNAAERGHVRNLAERLAREFPEPDGYLGSGARLLVAFGLVAIGEVRASARLGLSATAGDPDAGRLTIIDRALLFELLVAQAAEEGDLDAAEAWRARAEPLGAIPIANSAVSRLRARVALLAGRPVEAARLADLAVAQARAEGRAVEAAEGEVVAAKARVVLSRPGEARQLLEHLVATTDREGHRAVRRSAARLLRMTGQRLRPQPGSEWAGLSQRERDVALLVAAGLGNGEIAEELHVSPHTVRIHVSRVLAAFGAASRFAVIAHVAVLLPEVAAVRPLTARQRQVAERIATGEGNAEIARNLGVSVKTVEKHVGDIFRIWDVSSRLGIARLVLGAREHSE